MAAADEPDRAYRPTSGTQVNPRAKVDIATPSMSPDTLLHPLDGPAPTGLR